MNNYDTSSTGTDISVSIFYDTDLSRFYFEEFLQEVHRIDDYMFIDGDATQPAYKKSVLNRMTKAELYALSIGVYELGSWGFEAYTKVELIDDLLGVTWLDYYKQSQPPMHTIYRTIGYSQGDSAVVIKLDDCSPSYQQYLNNVFWDSPIYMALEVDDEEYRLDCIENNPYEWDIERIKQEINQLPINEYAKTWLISQLPEYPTYN